MYQFLMSKKSTRLGQVYEVPSVHTTLHEEYENAVFCTKLFKNPSAIT